MAHHLQPLFIFFLLTINHLLPAPAQTTQFNHGFLLKLTKHLDSHQYTTQLLIGAVQFPAKLVVHLSGQSIWLNCPPSSPSRIFIKRNSLQCLMAISGDQKTQASTVCNIHQQNPITGETNVGDLVQDTLTVDGIGPISTVDNLLFSCSPESLLSGLVAGANGVLALGRSKIAFQSQIANNFDFPRKFTLCLSSSDGFIISGAGDGSGVSKSLSYTPLMSSNNGYYMNVNSIRINGRRLAGGNPIGGVEISSTTPYTVMKSNLYAIFVKAFVSSMNMTTVSPVGPFKVCFKSPATVPEIELVLQSELVKWKIQRRNSMVEVSDSVMCLGVVDGGMNMNGEMILGGYQLEDHLLEFNLGTGMMGFSSSLLMEGNSCSSKIRSMVSTPKEIL